MANFMIGPGVRIGLLILALVCCAMPRAGAQQKVSIELVLAVDTSLSVNDLEYDLQMHGLARAFRDPEVMGLIAAQNGVAVALMQWAGWVDEQSTGVWSYLNSPQSVLAFAQRIEQTPRANTGIHTAIGTAIEAGITALNTNGYDGEQLKIDLSGDGISNAGPLPAHSRLLAEQLGITINGLAILTDVSSLDHYFRSEVVSGPGAFVIAAQDYSDFARAIKLKLLRELAVATSHLEPGSALRYRLARQ